MTAVVCCAVGLYLGSPPASHSESDSTEPAPKIWRAGIYSFSDELGGFSIVDVSGKGTFDDPVVITQDITTVAKSILTIRPLPVERKTLGFAANWTTLHLKLVSVNRSPASWIGYRIELQEELGTPSIYGDGLSFNQLNRKTDNIVSDRFSKFEVEHEPGDRLIFNDGWVDQTQAVSFTVFLLDLTPTAVFYVEQLPQLPAS